MLGECARGMSRSSLARRGEEHRHRPLLVEIGNGDDDCGCGCRGGDLWIGIAVSYERGIRGTIKRACCFLISWTDHLNKSARKSSNWTTIASASSLTKSKQDS